MDAWKSLKGFINVITVAAVRAPTWDVRTRDGCSGSQTRTLNPRVGAALPQVPRSFYHRWSRRWKSDTGRKPQTCGVQKERTGERKRPRFQ